MIFIGLNAGDFLSFFFFFTCPVWHCSIQNYCPKAKKNAFDCHILFNLYYLLIYFTFKLLQSEWTGPVDGKEKDEKKRGWEETQQKARERKTEEKRKREKTQKICLITRQRRKK